MKWPVLLLLAACSPKHWRDDPSKPPPGVIAKLAITHGTQLRILEITVHGIQSTRTVELGKYASQLVWGGAEPAVELADDDPHAPPFMARPVAQVFIGPEGPHPFLAYDWPAATDFELRRLIGRDGETWEGRCNRGTSADNRPSCDEGAWTFVRQSPAPMSVSHEPMRDGPSVAAPAVKPGLPLVVDKRGDAAFLKCTDGTGHAVQIPETPPDGFTGETAPIWLASEPPIFTAADTYPGFDLVVEPHIYVDCRIDGHLSRWLASPSGVVAIYGDRLDLVYGGKVIATADGGDLVAFAPTASALPAR